jgi:transposase
MLGDKAYDSAELREELDEQGTKSVIPNRSNRKQPFTFSKRLYKLRWRIEAAFNRLKDFRRRCESSGSGESMTAIASWADCPVANVKPSRSLELYTSARGC